MTQHLHREIDRLKEKILALGSKVEESLIGAVQSVIENKIEIANSVIEKDEEIDKFEIEIEEDCLKVLALHQPVAVDLRYIVAILKINNDLERIGDLAGNISELVIMKQTADPSKTMFDFKTMASISQDMVRDSLEALVNLNTELAFKVCAEDDRVDEMYYKYRNEISDEIVKHPERAKYLIANLTVYRMLERVADHATNIAEDVIYMINGDIVRHRIKDYTAK